MNTLNFFLTADYPTERPGPGDNAAAATQTSSAAAADADQPTEFTRQRDKLLQALIGLNADVLGLNELENTTGVDPLGDPTTASSPASTPSLGAGTYAYINTGMIGTDAIRVGLIYKPAVVTPVGDFQILDVDRSTRASSTRAAARRWPRRSTRTPTGARFTVVVNHLKSKGSACADIGDPDAGDGQGNCNQTRERPPRRSSTGWPPTRRAAAIPTS